MLQAARKFSGSNPALVNQRQPVLAYPLLIVLADSRAGEQMDSTERSAQRGRLQQHQTSFIPFCQPEQVRKTPQRMQRVAADLKHLITHHLRAALLGAKQMLAKEFPVRIVFAPMRGNAASLVVQGCGNYLQMDRDKRRRIRIKIDEYELTDGLHPHRKKTLGTQTDVLMHGCLDITCLFRGNRATVATVPAGCKGTAGFAPPLTLQRHNATAPMLRAVERAAQGSVLLPLHMDSVVSKRIRQ